MGYCVVLSTFPNVNEARTVSKKLVENKLCACANIIPTVNSIYVWQDKLVEDNEALVVLKTEQKMFQDVKDFISKEHSYEVPEIIMLEIKDGYEDYLSWISKNVRYKL